MMGTNLLYNSKQNFTKQQLKNQLQLNEVDKGYNQVQEQAFLPIVLCKTTPLGFQLQGQQSGPQEFLKICWKRLKENAISSQV